MSQEKINKKSPKSGGDAEAVKKEPFFRRYPEYTMFAVFGVMMLGAIIFAVWKCHYGYRDYDESYFLAIAHRLSKGDIMFKHEWNLSQMYGFLLIPFVKLYTMLAGSTEGIVFTARIVYTILHAAVSTFIFYRLRKYGYVMAFASVLFFLFAPFNIMAYSYNSMAIDLITLCAVVLATSDYKKKLPLALCGLMFAGAVLCSPYMLFVYALYVICVGVHHLLKKLNKLPNFALSSEMFSIKTLLWFTVGAAALAAVFMIYLFSRISIGGVFENIGVMMSYSRMFGKSFGDRVFEYFRTIYNSHMLFCVAFLVYLVILFAIAVDKKRKSHRGVYLILTALVVISVQWMYHAGGWTNYFNHIMFPMLFMGITAYILCENKPKEIFMSVFVTGLLYTFIAFYGSDQFFYIVSATSTVANVASFVFMAQLFKEIRASGEETVNAKKAFQVVCGVFISVIIVMQAYAQIDFKYNHCFWELNGIKALDAEITDGPAKGIYTTANTRDIYEQIYEDLKQFDEWEKKKVLVVYSNPWVYLQLDMPYAGYSAWIGDDRYTDTDTVVNELRDYYKRNPEKVPDYIYFFKDTSWDLDKIRDVFVDQGYVYYDNPVSYKYVRTSHIGEGLI